MSNNVVRIESRYYRRNDKKKGGISINSQEIGVCKYEEMLVAMVKYALEILGYGSTEKIESAIFGIKQKPKKNNAANRMNTRDCKPDSYWLQAALVRAVWIRSADLLYRESLRLWYQKTN